MFAKNGGQAKVYLSEQSIDESHGECTFFTKNFATEIPQTRAHKRCDGSRDNNGPSMVPWATP